MDGPAPGLREVRETVASGAWPSPGAASPPGRQTAAPGVPESCGPVGMHQLPVNPHGDLPLSSLLRGQTRCVGGLIGNISTSGLYPYNDFIHSVA